MSVHKWIVVLGIIVVVNQCVRAEDVAYLNNEAAGKIVITNEICESRGRVFENLRRIYATAPWGLVIEGCYEIDHDMVDAVFVNRQKHTYPLKDFVSFKKGLML